MSETLLTTFTAQQVADIIFRKSDQTALPNAADIHRAQMVSDLFNLHKRPLPSKHDISLQAAMDDLEKRGFAREQRETFTGLLIAASTIGVRTEFFTLYEDEEKGFTTLQNHFDPQAFLGIRLTGTKQETGPIINQAFLQDLYDGFVTALESIAHKDPKLLCTTSGGCKAQNATTTFDIK